MKTPCRLNGQSFAICAVLLLNLTCLAAGAQPVRIGSKPFNEGYILAEIMAQLLETRGIEVERKFGLGGTLICYEALTNAEIDLYPEYSGTIEQAILKLAGKKNFAELNELLQTEDLALLPSFGFNNTYAFAARQDFARANGLNKISDLQRLPEAQYAFSYEYMERGDGWTAVAKTYGLSASPTGMEHALCYPAIAAGEIDIMDVYSTDAEIVKYNLFLLEDDKDFFPIYLAAPLARADLDRRVIAVLSELGNQISEDGMQKLNAMVAIDGRTFAEAADFFLRTKGFKAAEGTLRTESKWQILADRTGTHLQLTAIALAAAILFAVPLGVVTYRMPRISNPVIYSVGLMQTIPSLALLAFMIAPFGTGTQPALIALSLYALLPILRNTYTALNSIDPLLRKVSIGMGLTAIQQLRHIEIPLAMPTILAGIRTAAVITIGTATLAAFIGAGGLGEYIQTGLALNDPGIIMWGAIPAALLAIITEFAFEGLEKALIPKHLQ